MNYAQLKVLIAFLVLIQCKISTAQCNANAGADTTICPIGTAVIGSANGPSVQLIVENANGCTDTTSLNITVHPLPDANFTYVSGNTCYTPTDFNFTNQTLGAINYQWSFGDGNQSNLHLILLFLTILAQRIHLYTKTPSSRFIYFLLAPNIWTG